MRSCVSERTCVHSCACVCVCPDIISRLVFCHAILFRFYTMLFRQNQLTSVINITAYVYNVRHGVTVHFSSIDSWQ